MFSPTSSPPLDPLRLLLRPRLPALALAVVLSVLAGVFELGPAVGVYFLAQLAFSPLAAPLSAFGVVLFIAGAVCFRFICLGGSLVLSHSVAFGLMRDVRRLMADRLAAVPLSFFDNHSRGDLKKTMIEDVDGLEGAFAHHIPEGGSAVVVPLLAVAGLMVADWRLALASVALVPVAVAVVSTTMRNFESLMTRWHDAEQRANDAILGFLRGIVVLKAFGRTAQSMQALTRSVEGIRDQADQMNRKSAPAYSAFMLLLTSNLVVVLPVGIWMFESGAINRSTLALFLALGYGVTAPLLKLMFLFGDVQMNGVRLRRIRALVTAKQIPTHHSPTPRRSTPPERIGVQVDAVSFRYSEDRGDVLKSISCTIEPRQLTAIVGPSGAGKSTLAQLLTGHLSPNQGVLSIVDAEGQPVDTSLLQAVGSVGQHAHLFFGTLRENLLMAAPHAGEQLLLRAASSAGLDEVIQRLPEGLDTPLGDRGAHLSGGEMQRVTIARALLQDHPIVVLDEVTSHLDPDNERAVHQGIQKLVANRTVIVIAHRLQTITQADNIIVVEDGMIVATGTHRELLRQSMTYRRMWDAQSSAANWTLPSPKMSEQARGAHRD